MSKSTLKSTSKDYYFDSYAHFGIHEEMLKDEVRTMSYYDAIFGNAKDFEGAVVLDVGCGTGILSLFAAKAGAKKVYAVDCSSIIDYAKKIVKSNGYEDVVECIKGKIEEIDLPTKVDIIISEWMGYFLLFESMLDTVIYARDKFLQPDGKLFPNRSRLFLSGIEDKEYKEEKIDYWNNVYGFNFECIKEWAYVEPLVDTTPRDQVITSTCKILDIDLHKVTKEELDFTAKFSVKCTVPETCHAFVTYFDCDFSDGTQKRVWFTTSPSAKQTHWAQTIFYLKKPVRMRKDEILTGEVVVKKNDKNPRDLDIKLDYEQKGVYQHVKDSQFYRLR